MINVKTDEIYGRNPVTSATDLRTHLVNIDSRFRQTQQEPPTDFQYRFAHPYKNVIKARVASVEIPKSFYAFSRAKKNTMFRIDTMDYTGTRQYLTVEIPEGDYSPECLVKSVQDQFDCIRVKYGIFFRIQLNPVSKRVTIACDGSAPPQPQLIQPITQPITQPIQPITQLITCGSQQNLQGNTYVTPCVSLQGALSSPCGPSSLAPPQNAGSLGPSAAPPPGPTHHPVTFGLTFVMVGTENRHYDFGLGANLGFIKHTYEVNQSTCFQVEGESLINTEGDAYFLLAIEDFHTVEHKTHDSYVQCLAKILVKNNTTRIIFDDGYTVLSNEIVFAQPMDLKQVRVRLIDAYGEPLDLHHNNLSISLEIKELMNVQLYDSYRTQTWSKAEPRAGLKGQNGPWSETGPRQLQHTSGSANVIAYPGRNFN